MDDETRDDEVLEQDASVEHEGTAQDDMAEGHSDYKPVNRFDAAAVHHLSGVQGDLAGLFHLNVKVGQLGDHGGEPTAGPHDAADQRAHAA